MLGKAATTTLALSVALMLGSAIPVVARAAASDSSPAPAQSTQDSAGQTKAHTSAKPQQAKHEKTGDQSHARKAADKKATPKKTHNRKAAGNKAAHKKTPPKKKPAQKAANPKNDNGVDFIKNEKTSQILASSILSMSIRDKSGDDADRIGTVNDLILGKDHKLVGIVVGVGGFLGMGQKNVGIPWSEVTNIDAQKRLAVVNVTKKQLQQAPAFATKQDQNHRKGQGALEKKAAAQHSIFFAFGKSQFDPKYNAVIATWAQYLQKNPKITVELQGRAGSHGTAAFNKVLAQKRAESVQAALEKKGIAASRVSIKVIGEVHQDCAKAKSKKACRAKNRRVDLVLP